MNLKLILILILTTNNAFLFMKFKLQIKLHKKAFKKYLKTKFLKIIAISQQWKGSNQWLKFYKSLALHTTSILVTVSLIVI